MLTKRIIPCLDIKNGRTVKGVQFLNLRDAGDPVELAKYYSDHGADELVFLDITATEEKRKTLASLARAIAREINIPFTIGGGIASIADVKMVLDAGADKVAINSAAIRKPELINELSSYFGSQCIVLAVDAKKQNDQWKVYLSGGKIETSLELFDWIRIGEERGAGEILFTSMNNDGEKNGYAWDTLAQISETCSLPLIASGGAGAIADFIEVFTKGKADAALAASVFHFKEIEIKNLKNKLSEKGIPVRL
jgi:cyclase